VPTKPVAAAASWAEWAQDRINDLLGYLDEITRELKRIADALEDANHGR
jgi:hypothetical protein